MSDNLRRILRAKALIRQYGVPITRNEIDWNQHRANELCCPLAARHMATSVQDAAHAMAEVMAFFEESETTPE